jgi:hypothetical protein
MLIQVVYFYEVVSQVDSSSIIVRNNFGQREFILNFSNKTTLNEELTNLKNRLQTTGLYKNGIFYPKVGEFVYSVSGVPKRKKILIDNEYLRS